MPRTDRSDERVIDWLGLPEYKPGVVDLPPIDLCNDCWMIANEEGWPDIEHPPYDDMPHWCFICKVELTNEDD